MKSAARENIRSAAARLFAEKGYAATTTREICQLAGVTKPVLYYHFTSKELLFMKLVTEAWQECYRDLLTASRRAKSARDQLVDVLAADFELTKRDPVLATMMFRMLFAPPDEAPSVDVVKIGLDWAGLIAGIAKQGIGRGEMRGTPREIGVAVLGVHIIYTLSFLLRGRPKLDRRLARRIVDLFVTGCGTVRGNR